MNLTQFFDASIRLQKYGYKIHFIESTPVRYLVRLAYADVCSGLAFGGVQYEIQFHTVSSETIPFHLYKLVLKKMKYEIEIEQKISTIDEAVDFIIADIQKLEEELKEEERRRVLDRLTQRERELLGV